MQPWNRGRETSEARGLKGQACRGALLQTPGAPWPGHRLHPTARIHGARPSSSISLAYILQQYRDIPLCTPAVALQQLREQRPAPSPGCSAGTSGRGPAGGRALAVGLGPPLACGEPGLSCLPEGSRPAGGAPSPLCHCCCTPESREPSGSRQLRPFSPALPSAANPRSKPGYRRGAESAALPSAQAGVRPGAAV